MNNDIPKFIYNDDGTLDIQVGNKLLKNCKLNSWNSNEPKVGVVDGEKITITNCYIDLGFDKEVNND